ncbi:MAG: thiamine pyrophosphate-dependent enzyme [Planctomycetota bacterium]|jgi:2-oxoisovalerate dehydrogenase E1 component
MHQAVGKSKSRFNLNRAQVVDDNLLARLDQLEGRGIHEDSRDGDVPVHALSSLTCRDAREIIESQFLARHQDIEARIMRARNEGFYTIGSAGHEGNAVVGRATRPTDMAFVHYRSGGFMSERARQIPGMDFVRDTMLSFAASMDDPISGGRHKVWGSVEMHVPPQTSTIASHLPKAVGTAIALRRSAKLNATGSLPRDSIVVVSFGDASANHAAAQTAFNAASWSTFQRIPVPVLFVCEDNRIGISVPSPGGWIKASFCNRPGITYFHADGLNIDEAYGVCCEAVEHCRRTASPVFLHLDVVRLLGHAGSDAETEYRDWDDIEASEARDPLLITSSLVIEQGVMTPTEVRELYESCRRRVKEAGDYAAGRPKLTSAEQIIKPLAPHHPDEVAREASRKPDQDERVKVFGDEDHLPERGVPRHMAVLINQGLKDLFIKYPEAILFGEDVARKGGVYHVTAGLSSTFGFGRVFNTLLDETTILGMAIGAAHVGLLPVPEIQYLAYYHNAEDQVRGEASSLQFFSNDQYRNPMVIRIAGWAYQKGFGGHFHNDNSIAALRDVPGLIIATPSRGDDAVNMMRTCMAAARVDGRVVAFIEPIALYMSKGLHDPKDGGWSFKYPEPGEFIPIGAGRVYNETARDVTILTFANGVYMSLRAANTLKEKHGVSVRVVDLRWLNPLNEKFIGEQAEATGKVLVVDESRRTGGLGEAILAIILEQCGGQVDAARLTGHDSFIPLGEAANRVLLREDDIVESTLELAQRR